MKLLVYISLLILVTGYLVINRRYEKEPIFDLMPTVDGISDHLCVLRSDGQVLFKEGITIEELKKVVVILAKNQKVEYND